MATDTKANSRMTKRMVKVHILLQMGTDTKANSRMINEMGKVFLLK